MKIHTILTKNGKAYNDVTVEDSQAEDSIQSSKTLFQTSLFTLKKKTIFSPTQR